MTSRLDKVKFYTILDSDELEIPPRKWIQWFQDIEAGVCLIVGGPALKQFLDYLLKRDPGRTGATNPMLSIEGDDAWKEEDSDEEEEEEEEAPPIGTTPQAR